MDWRSEFFDFGDVTYLNVSGHAPLPRVSAKALQAAVEWKKFPHLIPDGAYFDVPNRIRALLAPLVGGGPEEIAVTTGATNGLAAVAHGINWKPDDEVIVAQGEFPAHFSVFSPLAEAGTLRLKVVAPRDRFITADDLAAHITPKTRLVSTSLVRFDNAVRIDAPKLAAACRSAGAMLLLDVSQCAGAMPLDLRALGADFAVCSGYKWLMSTFGTGFFWTKLERIAEMRPVPFYWMAVEGAENFHSLGLGNWAPARAARRWDSPETASFFNLFTMEASLEFISKAGTENIWQHNSRLMEQMLERLPRDRCIPASPAESAQRGPYACIAGRSPEKTKALYLKLREAKIFVSLREGALRVAPYLYNSERDIDRLLMTLAT